MHSGMTGLVGAAKRNLNMTVFILDNATVGMTGGQATMATGDQLAQVVKGLGVHPDHVHVINPHRKNHAANVEIVRKEIEYRGLSVIIPSRECIQTAVRK
jgi:indolepyruvate ferredoxin oxidoreductase alpha subunit